jgi:hypothetical protein
MSIANSPINFQLTQNTNRSIINIPIIINNNNRICNLRNKMGIITPQMTDDFLMNSFVTENKNKNKNKNKEENIEYTLTNENTTNKSSNNPFNNSNKLYLNKIKCNNTENEKLCKPNLNSTISKALMKEYSISKRYQEDQLLLFSSIEESAPIKSLKKSEKIEKSEQIPAEIVSEVNELEDLLRIQEANLPVPLSKKDNEKYKILKIKQMKRVSMPPNKSVRKFEEEIEPQYQKEFRIHNAFSAMKKRKPVHSTRRIYSSNFFLYKNKNDQEGFMVFRDKDIGIYEYWQAHIHEAHNDEDVETDEEQKNIARNFCISEVREGLEYIKNNGDNAFVNFHRYDNFICKTKAKKIMNVIEDNLRNINLSKVNKRKQ